MAIDTGGRKTEQVSLDEVLDELEQKVERLKILYEQYFMGIEKVEPLTVRKEVTRKLRELTQQNLRNTGLRYRFNSLNQRFGVYVTYWNRTLRAIENGTYTRMVARAGRDALRRGLDMPEEVLRALPPLLRERMLQDRARLAAKQARDDERRRAKQKQALPRADEATSPEAEPAGLAEPPPETPATAPAAAAPPSVPVFGRGIFDGDVDDEFDSAFGNLTAPAPTPAPSSPPPAPARPHATPPPIPRDAARPPAPAPAHATPAPRAPAPRPPSLPPGVDEATAHALYKRYVEAKRALGEDTSRLRYEHLVQTLAKQAPQVMERCKARGVEFTVVVKDDKVLLKATPKK